MPKHPLVSVIIPNYNQGEYIKDALNSANSSSYSNIEIIIVNDGSTDPKTIDIINNINTSNTFVINIQNGGLANARNVGIKSSKGKYILPLDADDKISSSYIEESVNILESNNNIKLVTSDVELFGAASGKMTLMEFSTENLLCQNTMVCSSIFRRSDYNKTQGYNPNMKYGFEDWDFWLSLLSDGGDVYKIPKVHMYYRIKKSSMIANLVKKSEHLKEMRYQIYQNHKELYSKYFFDPTKSFEYALIQNSKEYKVGKAILMPLRYLIKLLK
jgi:glycosyltransferase involved in cell wall biosynthesis